MYVYLYLCRCGLANTLNNNNMLIHCYTYDQLLSSLIIIVGVTWAWFFLQVIDNQVVMVRTKQKDGYFGLQIGAHDNPKLKNVSV